MPAHWQWQRRSGWKKSSAGIKPHFVPGQPHAGERGPRRLAGEAGDPFADLRDAQGEPVRQFSFGGRQPGDFFERDKCLLHRPVALLVAQNIPAANLTFFRRQNMPHGHIADVNPV